MKKIIKKPKFNDGWCFAVVNGRLAEIYFKKNYGIYAHCYIKREEFNKSEQKMIDTDIKKCQFIYQKGYYSDKISGFKFKVPKKIEDIFPDIKDKNKFLTLNDIFH